MCTSAMPQRQVANKGQLSNQLDDNTDVSATVLNESDPSVAAAGITQPQWQREAAIESEEMCQKHSLAHQSSFVHVHEALQMLYSNFFQALTELLTSSRPRNYGDSTFSWKHEDEIAFHAAMDQVVNSIKSSATRADILIAVQHRMPDKTLDQVRHMDRKVWADYMFRTKRRDLAKMWGRQHASVLLECEQLLAESAAAATQNALYNAEVVETEVARLRAHGKHDYQRQVYDKHALERQVTEAVERARYSTAADAKTEAATQRQQVSKVKVDMYRQHLASNAQAEQASMMEQLLVKQLQMQPEKLQNSMRVRHRDGLTCKKREDLRMQAQMKQQQAQAREMRLERIRSMVKVHVQPDKERPLKPTKCMLAEAYCQHSLFAEAHGYSADVVTSDKRHKAMTMLRSRGLLGKEYAQDALRHMYNSAKPRRADCLTSDQLLGSYVAPRMV
eukprot:jgi/Ulvmu1/4505/UM002_0231.1